MKFPNELALSMECDSTDALLLDAEDDNLLLEQVISMKNQVIGNKKQKISLINQGVITRLHQILNDAKQKESIRIEAVTVLCSLVKGEEYQLKEILSSGIIQTLILGLNDGNTRYAELCLCCLRTIAQSAMCPKDFLYKDPCLVPRLLSLADLSINAQTSVATILSECCQTEQHQNYLHSKNVVELMLPALFTNITKLEIAVLRLYTRLCYQNKIVSTQMLASSYYGASFCEVINRHIGRDKPLVNRMLASKCFVYLYRAEAMQANDSILLLRVIPTLVTCCKPQGHTIKERIDGAEMLAYLTQTDLNLQRYASITDHCIRELSSFFKEQIKLSRDDQQALHQAGLAAFASLAANAEDIRKKIMESESIMGHILAGLSSRSSGLQLSAARCLHSLSRSVQQLRTSFQDHTVWKELMSILNGEQNEEMMTVVSATLCNLLLEFSPGKEPLLELGAIDLLVKLSYLDRTQLRLNAVWGLLNVSFKTDQRTKLDIINKLSKDRLFSLLRDPSPDIAMKTWGLLRNLLSSDDHIDIIMRFHGDSVIQAIVMILESDHNPEVKEQALCTLGHIASGGSSKRFIMDNDDILKKIFDYMRHSNLKLQIAATVCVQNLVYGNDGSDAGAEERHRKLRHMDVQRILQQLLSYNDKELQNIAQATIQYLT